MLYGDISRDYRASLINKSHKQSIPSLLLNGTDYISELIYLDITTEEETLKLARMINDVSTVITPEHYLLFLLASILDL